SRGQGLGKGADRASDETLCPDSQARERSQIGYPARAAIHGSVPRIAGIHLALAAPVPRQCWKQRKQRLAESGTLNHRSLFWKNALCAYRHPLPSPWLFARPAIRDKNGA